MIKNERHIFNSDQGRRPSEATTSHIGGQYTAKEHIKILSDNNISISMDAKGRSIDNIVIERFWRTLKYEDIYQKVIKQLRSQEMV